MRILLLAPHPFYQERGTPIAVDLLLKALSDRGDSVDLLTYHEGSDREYPNVRIFRIHPWIKVHHIRPGFSWKKILCDLSLFFKFIKLLRQNQYDIVHAVEEAAFMAMMICPLFSLPFIYDMDSLLSTQIVDKYQFAKMIQRFLRFMESLAIRRAQAVLPVCDALADDAEKLGARKIVVLKDVSLRNNSGHDKNVIEIRKSMNLKNKIVMYIGNLERYQGIDLLIESFAFVLNNTQADLVIIGGQPEDIEKYKKLSRSFKIEKHVHFLGPKPIAHIQLYMAQADLLVSPRIQGSNTPMKIYSYLHSGVPVVATNLFTHTQVLNSDIAYLAEPDKESFAAAILSLFNNEALARELARNAFTYIEKEHSFSNFKEKLYHLYDEMEAMNSY